MNPRQTRPELRLLRAMQARGLRPHVNWGRPEIDLAFPHARLGVQVDGCFWHRCPVHFVLPRRNARWWDAKMRNNAMRDMASDRTWASRGWLVLRTWEHEDPRAVAQRVAAILSRRIA